MLEKKVYSGWAFHEDATMKKRINEGIYRELKDRVLYIYGTSISQKDLARFCCLEYVGHGYANTKYRILSNPYGFTNDEIALLADGGNLCFGYRMEGANVVVVYTD